MYMMIFSIHCYAILILKKLNATSFSKRDSENSAQTARTKKAEATI